jgi:hypothetical protein
MSGFGFGVGDKVRVSYTKPGTLLYGKVGTVVSVRPNNEYYVDFPDGPEFDSGFTRNEDGTVGFSFYTSELAPA